ncbi:MAG: ribonuclease P protein component [Parcubacteria group bacterium]|jgi:ribonuclease P protein component
MLPFKNRLTKRKDFEKVQKVGQFFSDANVALKIMENGMHDSRIGFVAGLKFSKKAVERNQVKRQMRDLFQKHLAQIKGGLDVVVMIRKRDDERIHLDKLEKNIARIIEKSNLLKIQSK